MDSSAPTRSFTPLACSLLFVGLAVYGTSALARDPAPAMTVAEQSVVIPAAISACRDDSIDGCQVHVNSWHVDGFAPPGRAAPTGTDVPLVGDDPAPALQTALRLQQNLFTRGGRLAPIDLFIADDAIAPVTERTGKAPDWAAQLRAARTEQRKEGG